MQGVEEVVVEHDGAVATVWLNRPAAHNALSENVLSKLAEAFGRLAAEPGVRVVVLAAKGRAFSAGHDLREMRAEPGEQYYRQLFDRCTRVMTVIRSLPQPVIARVQGVATAAGCQLVATCDLAVASAEARFATPGVHIGLFCSTPMVALSRNIGAKTALDMLMTGEMIDADRALAVGLVSRIALPGELRAETDKVIDRLLARPPSVLALGKRAFYEQLRLPLSDAYRLGLAVIVDNMVGEEAEEGIRAFVEKRRPKW